MNTITKTTTDLTLKAITKDNRKKYFCILDVETTGETKKSALSKPLIYDLGFAITDRKGNIIYKRSLLIKEILCGKLMVNAYYAEKLPKYMQGIAEGHHELVSWNEAREILGQALTHFEVKTIGAYNWQFDRRALESTVDFLENEKLVINIEKELCLWSLACETIFSQKSYAGVALDQEWFSPKGNLLTNAEVCYRYLTGEFEFIEDHTGLSDVIIEVFIMQHAFRQNKKVKSGVLGGPWRIPNKLHKEKKENYFMGKESEKAVLNSTPLIILDLA